MSREEVKNAILGMRPIILKQDEIDNIGDKELLEIYYANRGLDYCKLLIKHQMISVILYVTGPAYTKSGLLAMDSAEVQQIYLMVRQLTEEQFAKMVDEAVADFKSQAIEDSDDAYMSFSRDEVIIATGIIMPEPLLSYEEIQTQSLLKRIDEITKEIAELEEDSRLTEELLETCDNYMARNEYYNDLSCNARKIQMLKGELTELTVGRKSVGESRVRKPND